MRFFKKTFIYKNIGQGGVYSFGYISEPDPQYKGTKNFLDYQIIMDFFLWKFFIIFIKEYIYNYGLRYREIKKERGQHSSCGKKIHEDEVKE